MQMTYEKLNTWISKLAKTKPYRISLKNGNGFYEVVFFYQEFHYNDKIFPKDMEDELECQKKVLTMCHIVENNFKIRHF